jgi:hypothetical protein
MVVTEVTNAHKRVTVKRTTQCFNRKEDTAQEKAVQSE